MREGSVLGSSMNKELSIWTMIKVKREKSSSENREMYDDKHKKRKNPRPNANIITRVL